MPISYSVCAKIQEERSIGKDKKDRRQILRKVCEKKSIESIKVRTEPDYIHIL